jgi:hypothetical protein
MMLPALPELKAPTVTTPNSMGSFSRLITPVHHHEARGHEHGVNAFVGMEPWLPRP